MKKKPHVKARKNPRRNWSAPVVADTHVPTADEKARAREASGRDNVNAPRPSQVTSDRDRVEAFKKRFGSGTAVAQRCAARASGKDMDSTSASTSSASSASPPSKASSPFDTGREHFPTKLPPGYGGNIGATVE